MNRTKIPFATHGWNPIEGCSWKSGGCSNCYARTLAKRWKWYWGPPRFREDLLDEPRNPKKDALVFICPRSDLFHEECRDSWIDAVMEKTQVYGGNRYIVVTKRPKMALAWTKRTSLGWWQRGWPKNVALLVTTENQERYDERIEYLQRIPVYPAGVIVEPMLGPVDLGFYPPISWVVAGPETGRCPRLFRDEWLDDLETQCMAVGIAFFDKREEWNTRMWPEGFRPGA